MINCVLKVNDLAFVLSCWDYVIPLSRITFIVLIVFIHGEHWTVYPISNFSQTENIKIEPDIFQNKDVSYDVTLSGGLSCALPELQQPQLFSWTVISGKTKPKINSPYFCASHLFLYLLLCRCFVVIQHLGKLLDPCQGLVDSPHFLTLSWCHINTSEQ